MLHLNQTLHPQTDASKSVISVWKKNNWPIPQTTPWSSPCSPRVQFASQLGCQLPASRQTTPIVVLLRLGRQSYSHESTGESGKLSEMMLAKLTKNGLYLTSGKNRLKMFGYDCMTLFMISVDQRNYCQQSIAGTHTLEKNWIIGVIRRELNRITCN